MASPLVTARDLTGLLGPVTVLDVRYQTGGPGGRQAYEAGQSDEFITPMAAV